MFREFIEFLKHYGVIGLAIAVIIGGKANDLVSSLVKDLLIPLIFQPALRAAHAEDIEKLSYKGIHYGKVAGSLIEFMIVASVVFMIAKFVLREEKVGKKWRDKKTD
jgi:large conductance mechanosensitive channel